MATIKQTLHWGIIGANPSAALWCEALQSLTDTQVLAVASKDKSAASTFARRFGLKHSYNDAQQLTDDARIDAILVATPASTHATFAMMAMRAGKPVCVLPPLTRTYEDCLRLNRISQETNLPCFVAFYRRTLPIINKVKELIEHNIVGTLLNIQMNVMAPVASNLADINATNIRKLGLESDNNDMFSLVAPQQLDIIQEIFGIIVKAHGYENVLPNTGMQDRSIAACLRFSSGLVGSAAWSFCQSATDLNDFVEVFGTDGTLKFSVYDEKPIILQTPHREEIIDVDCLANPYQLFLQQMSDHIRGLNHCSSDSISATSVCWLMDRILWKV